MLEVEELAIILLLAIVWQLIAFRLPPQWFDKYLNHRLVRNLPLIAFIPAIFLISLNTLKMGDGLIIYENILLEASLFGYQLTIDELLPVLFHSWLYQSFFTDNVRTVYQFSGILCGLIYAILSFWFSNRYRLSFLANGMLMFSGGSMVYYGYMENYAPVAIILAIIVYSGYHISVQRPKNNTLTIMVMAVLAAVAFLHHILNGFLIFFLIYFCHLHSENRRIFWRNAILAAGIGMGILAIVFGYFLFFAEVRVDLTQSHMAHPPTYPFKRMISINHLKELSSAYIFSAFAAFFILLNEFMSRRQDLKEFFQQSNHRLLATAVFSMFVMTFVLNPILGFPGDWDLMGFIWMPLSLLIGVYLQQYPHKNRQYLVLIIVQILLFFFTITKINQYSEPEKKLIQAKIKQVEKYVFLTQQKISQLPAREKKFYAKVDFFLFRTGQQLQNELSAENFESFNSLLNQQMYFKSILDKNISANSDSRWKQQLLQQLAHYHHDFLNRESRP